MITYKPETHEYFDESGNKVDSVNQILKAEGIIPDFSLYPGAEYKRELGTNLHSAIKYHLKNTLDGDTIVPPLLDYYYQFLKFFKENLNLEYIAIRVLEEPLISKKWQYAGTPDIVVQYKDKNILIDWKCSKHLYPMYLLTLPAYSLLVEENLNIKIDTMWMVQFNKNDYKIIQMDKKYLQVWQAVLLSYQFKKNNNLLKE